MFDSETRWFIRCDTCPDETGGYVSWPMGDKDAAAVEAKLMGWDVRDGLHRCPRCVREGRTAMAS